MAQQRIGAEQIADGTVVASDIADGSISVDKISFGTVLDKANSGSSYANSAFTTANTSSSTATSAAAYANAAFAQANTDYTTASISAGSYGSSSAIPVLTLAANGRVTAVSTSSVSGGVTSLNGQTGSITDTDVGAIGSVIAAMYAVSHSTTDSVRVSVGTTVSGSSLRYNPTINYWSIGGLGSNGSSDYSTYPAGGTSLSGTWRAMSPNFGSRYSGSYSSTYYWHSSLWVRVS